MTFLAYPSLQFNDAYSQPSDPLLGRRLSVIFDTANIYTRNTDGYFSDSGMIVSAPVIVTVHGITAEGPLVEDFVFNVSGEEVEGFLHFQSFSSVSIDGYKIILSAPYGAVEVRETLPVNFYDDGYNSAFANFISYGNGIFLYSAKNIDGYDIDLGYGQYEFEYAAPFSVDIITSPENIFIGNDSALQHSADGILDEVKITTIMATKSRTRKFEGSYDISVEATSPIFSEPDAKTLVLLHLNDNTQTIIDALRDPLDSANLSDSVLSQIVSFRNDHNSFIDFVNSLNITGTIVDNSIDTRSFAEQLFDLVDALNQIINSANYYILAGKFMPSEIIVNSNFKFAAVFSGETYFIEKPGLINNNTGSIELWIAPLQNLLGDFNRKVYLDSINHSIVGLDGNFHSDSTTTITLPNNILAKYINSIRTFDDSNNFDFADNATIINNGNVIVLNEPLPMNNTAIVVDYVPLSSANDRLTLFKDEDSNLIFSISASGLLYQTSHDISNWKKNEWHRVMITWKTNDKNYFDRLNMYVDGIESEIIKYGEGFLFNTFVFKQEHQVDINTKIVPQNIQLGGTLDKLYIGEDFLTIYPGMCRMANVRVSFIERQPVIDAHGFKIDFDFDGGAKSATPEINDQFTSYLEDFNPQNAFVENFATIQDPTSGAHDLSIMVRDNFHLVRGINNGQTERLLRELIKIIHPAEARTRISITTNN
jgi:hypothetical protein